MHAITLAGISISSWLECLTKELGCLTIYETPRVTADPEEDNIDTGSESVAWTKYFDNAPDRDPSGTMLAPMKLEYIERALLFILFGPVTVAISQYLQPSRVKSPNRIESSMKQNATSPPSSNSSEDRQTKRTKIQL
jgi:hypothetical protein